MKPRSTLTPEMYEQMAACVHEAGHGIVARVLGHSVSGVTLTLTADASPQAVCEVDQEPRPRADQRIPLDADEPSTLYVNLTATQDDIDTALLAASLVLRARIGSAAEALDRSGSVPGTFKLRNSGATTVYDHRLR